MQRASRRLLRIALALAGLASAAGAAELKVEWAPMTVTLDAYQIERRIGESGEAFVAFVRVPGDSTSFIDRNVTAGVRYCYRVRGVRGQRMSAPSPELCSVATEALPEPSLVGVTPLERAPSQPTPSASPPVPEVAAAAAASPPVAEVAAAAVANPPVPEVRAAAAASPPTTVAAAASEPVSQSAPSVPPPSTPIAGDREVKALSRPPPIYPAKARAQEVEGWVKLSFTVTALGTTRDIQVVAAEPPGVFDAAATEAAARFRYSPRVRQGVAVDRPGVEIEITFSLVDRGGDVVNFPR